MKKVKLTFKSVFKEGDDYKTTQQLVDELVKETVNKVLTKYTNTAYN